jgi:hypothetical protein
MSAPFTPGPWLVDEGGIRCDHSHNYGIVAQVHEGHVYSEYTSDSPTLDFANAADARLVAAAPELYDTIRRVADQLVSIEGRTKGDRLRLRDQLAVLRAALAKARGQ